MRTVILLITASSWNNTPSCFHEMSNMVVFLQYLHSYPLRIIVTPFVICLSPGLVYQEKYGILFTKVLKSWVHSNIVLIWYIYTRIKFSFSSVLDMSFVCCVHCIDTETYVVLVYRGIIKSRVQSNIVLFAIFLQGLRTGLVSLRNLSPCMIVLCFCMDIDRYLRSWHGKALCHQDGWALYVYSYPFSTLARGFWLSGKTLDCRPRDCEFYPPSLQLK